LQLEDQKNDLDLLLLEVSNKQKQSQNEMSSCKSNLEQELERIHMQVQEYQKANDQFAQDKMQLKHDYNRRMNQLEQGFNEKLDHKAQAIEKAQLVISTLTEELERITELLD